MEIKSIGGVRYLLTFVDDYSRKVFTYFQESKDQVTETFKDLLRKASIKHNLTVPYNPQEKQEVCSLKQNSPQNIRQKLWLQQTI